jgi:hypothetical protein
MFSSNTAHSGLANYVEDVFSTYLYTGTGASQTITNGIDLTGKGGLVWQKSRSAPTSHKLTDTVRGVTKALSSDTADVQTTDTTGLTAFNTTGFTIGANSNYNTSASTYASWTFRKQPKFFDIVTYTGTGSTDQVINHSLGTVPGMIIVKPLDAVAGWSVYHRSLGYTKRLVLNATSVAEITDASIGFSWGTTGNPTSTTFTVGDTAGNPSTSAVGINYVAYLFAHDAGGFGLTGQENVISCGSYTGTAAPLSVNLGYEPQWLLVKSATNNTNDWYVLDVMRGMSQADTAYLVPNTAAAESIFGAPSVFPTATGFQVVTTGTAFNQSGATYIYIAIRRGPMRVPTDATKVFAPVAYTGNNTARTITSNFPVDMFICSDRNNTSNLVGYKQALFDRVLGNAQGFITASSAAWGGGWGDTYFNFASSTGIPLTGNFSYLNNSTTPYVNWMFQRATSFFDIVAYTGTGVAKTVTHNLGAVPELIIVKGKSVIADWQVYSSTLANTEYVVLNATVAKATGATSWNSTTPTSLVFSIGTALEVNNSGSTYAAYLFATCAGVSKVGSYTGTATTQQINCGFTSGARFVLIKRTDSTGDWYIWDTARSIITGNDPYLLLNSVVAEATTTDYIDPYSPGFEISSTAPAAINASGGTYIFLAIA